MDLAPINEPLSLLPDSKDFQIKLPHIGKTITIKTDNLVEKIYTESTAVQVTSPSGEILTVRPKHFSTSKTVDDLPIIRKHIRVQKDNPFLRRFFPKKNHKERKLQTITLTFQPPIVQSTPTPQNKFFMSEADEHLLTHNIDLDIHRQKLQVALNNIQNLERQFINITNDVNDINQPLFSTDANTRNLINNFVVHLNYINSQQQTSTDAPLPSFYNYYTQSEMRMSDMVSPSQWTTFTQKTAIGNLIARKINPFALNAQIVYGDAIFGNQRNFKSKRVLHIVKKRPNRKNQGSSNDTSSNRPLPAVSPFEGYKRVTLPNKISKEQLPVFILIVSGVESHYEILFNMLPKTGTVNTDLQQLKYQNALVVFHKVSQFATITYMTLENIWNDLNEIDVYFRSIANTTLNTMSFYRLDDDYLEIKCKFGNKTDLINQMNNEIGNLTLHIQTIMSQTLVSVTASKTDVSTLLNMTSVYRSYTGPQDLYSDTFQTIIKKSINDVDNFWNAKIKIDANLEQLKLTQIELRSNGKIMHDLVQKYRKMASAVRTTMGFFVVLFLFAFF